MKEKITKEEFSFHGYFSSHYGLGPQPEMMPANVKVIVLGVILFIAGIVVTALVNAVGLVLSLIGIVAVVVPVLKKAANTNLRREWAEERARRETEWSIEFDKKKGEIIAEQKLEERGLQYLGIDKENLIKDDKDNVSSFYISGNNFDGGWRKIGTVYRTEYQEITWLYFGVDQLYIYKVKLSLIAPSKKKEESLEFFYKDIVSVSVAQETIDIKGEAADGGAENDKQVESERFRLVVPGDKLNFAYIPNDYTTARINAMKSMIREKKNS